MTGAASASSASTTPIPSGQGPVHRAKETLRRIMFIADRRRDLTSSSMPEPFSRISGRKPEGSSEVEMAEARKKVLRIGIASVAFVKARTIAIAKGHRKRTSGEPEVWFTSIHSLAQVLSEPNRLL